MPPTTCASIPHPGPLYNTLDWGGFLIWYMPDRPVAIDGRTDLYGDDLDAQFFNTANGAASYVDDPYLNQAGVVILQKTNNLVSILQADPRFHWCTTTHLRQCLFAPASHHHPLRLQP